jgi:ElaA protein
MEYTFDLYHFQQLTNEQLYKALKLRCDVFVVEQGCAYPELDDVDTQCFHVLCFRDNELMAYSRIVPPGLLYKEASIGRIVTAKGFRGSNIGAKLVEQSIAHCKVLFRETPIRIMAQKYLEPFYSKIGFRTVSDPFSDFNVIHVYMLLEAQN